MKTNWICMGMMLWMVCIQGIDAFAQLTIGEGQLVENINSDTIDAEPNISPDGLTIYFVSDRGAEFPQIWMATRNSTSEPFGDPVKLGSNINGGNTAQGPHIPGGFGDADIWMSARPSVDAEWGEPVNLGENINSTEFEGEPSLTSDELILIYDSKKPGGHGENDIWMSTRESIDDPWGLSVNLGPRFNQGTQRGAAISRDGLFLVWFNIFENDGTIQAAIRESIDEEFGDPFLLFDVGSGGVEQSGFLQAGGPSISADNQTLYFLGLRPEDILEDEDGNVINVDFNVFQAPLIPAQTSSVLNWNSFQ